MQKKLYVLVCCEESQAVANAFRKLGHYAYSCDLQRCSGGHPEWHIMSDCFSVAYGNCLFISEDGEYHRVKQWDLVIAHPPCTYLCVASAPSLFPSHGVVNAKRFNLMINAKDFFLRFFTLPCRHLAIENPTPLKIAALPTSTQVIQPCYFGHPFTKTTHLWLVNLPPLISTCIVPDYKSYHDTVSGSKMRSKTFPGIAAAMAEQWSNFLISDYDYA